MPASSMRTFWFAPVQNAGKRLCGITVAPIIPMAIYSTSVIRYGRNKTMRHLPRSGLASSISIGKKSPITATRAGDKGFHLSHTQSLQKQNRKVSSTVISTPHNIGKPVGEMYADSRARISTGQLPANGYFILNHKGILI